MYAPIQAFVHSVKTGGAAPGAPVCQALCLPRWNITDGSQPDTAMGGNCYRAARLGASRWLFLEMPRAERWSDPSEEGPGEAYREGGLPSWPEDSRDSGGSWPRGLVWADAPGQRLGAVTVPSKRCKEVQRHLRGVQKLVSTDVVNHCEMEQNSRWDSKVVMATPHPPPPRTEMRLKDKKSGWRGRLSAPSGCRVFAGPVPRRTGQFS